MTLACKFPQRTYAADYSLRSFFVCLSLYLCVCLFICLFICVFVSSYVCLSVCLSPYLFVCLYVLSVWISVCSLIFMCLLLIAMIWSETEGWFHNTYFFQMPVSSIEGSLLPAGHVVRFLQWGACLYERFSRPSSCSAVFDRKTFSGSCPRRHSGSTAKPSSQHSTEVCLYTDIHRTLDFQRFTLLPNFEKRLSTFTSNQKHLVTFLDTWEKKPAFIMKSISESKRQRLNLLQHAWLDERRFIFRSDLWTRSWLD